MPLPEHYADWDGPAVRHYEYRVRPEGGVFPSTWTRIPEYTGRVGGGLDERYAVEKLANGTPLSNGRRRFRAGAPLDGMLGRRGPVRAHVGRGQRFEFFRDLPGPLRIPDVPAYVRALGFSPDDRLPSKTFQGTPMRHRGVHVGNFYQPADGVEVIKKMGGVKG